MIALATFWATFVFLIKAALAAFGAGLAFFVFGAIFVAILLSSISDTFSCR
jgi:hypothetical protein